ncbi:hypothetical protein DPV73_08830 [Leptospira mayottensis]|nr:hypothetical protein DPV73_08830 [Leptospira mayottensis]
METSRRDSIQKCWFFPFWEDLLVCFKKLKYSKSIFKDELALRSWIGRLKMQNIFPKPFDLIMRILLFS